MQLPRQFTQRYKVQDIDGHQLVVRVVCDMTNKELAQALSHFQEREDFEYCEEILAEAELRGITLTTKKHV